MRHDWRASIMGGMSRKKAGRIREVLLVVMFSSLLLILSRPRGDVCMGHTTPSTRTDNLNKKEAGLERTADNGDVNLGNEIIRAPAAYHPVKGDNKKQPVDGSFTPVDRVSKGMEEKLSLPPVRSFKVPQLCKDVMARGNSCNGTCLRTQLDLDLKTRIAQIVKPAELQMKAHQREVLDHMASQVKGYYDVIIITAASDNHFMESQGLIRTLYLHVFPHIQNFTFLYYDLGLTETHRTQLERHCKWCQVLDFPFTRLPEVFSLLACYAWKPLMVAAHHKQANIVVWLDASIRFDRYPDGFSTLVNKTKERGIQLNGLFGEDVASRTVPSLYHFFGEEPCTFLSFGELATGVMFFAREYFVERAIMEPWVACAFDRRCMCPDPKPPVDARKSNEAVKRWKNKEGPMVYGLAHRFEQSTLSLLVMKLFRERYRDVAFSRQGYLNVSRHESVDFLPVS